MAIRVILLDGTFDQFDSFLSFRKKLLTNDAFGSKISIVNKDVCPRDQGLLSAAPIFLISEGRQPDGV